MKKRLLIIAPHADDEVLGCGGTIARYVAEGWNVRILIAAVSDVYVGAQLKSSARHRIEELERSCRILGADSFQIGYDDKENLLDTLPLRDIIGMVQDELSQYAPDDVFLPLPSHHQDHRVIFDASLAALRPGGLASPPRLIAAYEYTYTGWYPKHETNTGFLYKDITQTLDTKIRAWEAYASQGRDPNHPLSAEAILALARMRGVEAGCTYAERFNILKLVD